MIVPETTQGQNTGGGGCTAACCAGQAVGNDDYVASILTEQFVKSQIHDHSLKPTSLMLAPRPLEETLTGPEDEATEAEYVVMTYRVFAFEHTWRVRMIGWATIP
jgi:hypothetical protein